MRQDITPLFCCQVQEPCNGIPAWSETSARDQRPAASLQTDIYSGTVQDSIGPGQITLGTGRRLAAHARLILKHSEDMQQTQGMLVPMAYALASMLRGKLQGLRHGHTKLQGLRHGHTDKAQTKLHGAVMHTQQLCDRQGRRCCNMSIACRAPSPGAGRLT
jgi:hypothetical protein